MSGPDSPISASTLASASFLMQSLREKGSETSSLTPKAFHMRSATTAVDSVLESRKSDCGLIKLRVETIRSRIGEEERAGISAIDSAKRNALEVLSLAFEEQKWKFRDVCSRFLAELAAVDCELDSFLRTEEHQLSPLADFLRVKCEFGQILHLRSVDLRPTLIDSVEKSISYRESSLMSAISSAESIENSAEFSVNSLNLMLSLRHVWSESQISCVSKQLFESGRLKTWQEDFEGAEEDCRKALELLTARFPHGRKTVECMLQLGRVWHIGMARVEQAKTIYLEATDICEEWFPYAPEMIDACACLTGLCASLKDMSGGELWFEKGKKLATERHPTSLLVARLYRAYGCIKRQSHDLDSAFQSNLHALSLSLQLSPSSWDVVLSYLAVGTDYRDFGRVPEAESAFLKGAEFNPPCGYSVRCYLSLARMYRKENRREDARNALQKALAMGLKQFPRAKSTKEVITETGFGLISRRKD